MNEQQQTVSMPFRQRRIRFPLLVSINDSFIRHQLASPRRNRRQQFSSRAFQSSLTPAPLVVRCRHRNSQQNRSRLNFTVSNNGPESGSQTNFSNENSLRINRSLEDSEEKSCIEYMITFAYRFVPILIASISVICLLIFLINYRISIAALNITFIIIFTVTFFFVIYTIILFYLYRKFYSSESTEQSFISSNDSSAQASIEQNRINNYQQQNEQSASRIASLQHHRRHTIDVTRLSIQQELDLPFVINGGDVIINHTDDVDEGDDQIECYDCRMERLRQTDRPPPYESPPKYAELSVEKLIKKTVSSNFNDKSNR